MYLDVKCHMSWSNCHMTLQQPIVCQINSLYCMPSLLTLLFQKISQIGTAHNYFCIIVIIIIIAYIVQPINIIIIIILLLGACRARLGRAQQDVNVFKLL